MKPVIGINLDIFGESPKIGKIQAFYYQSIGQAGGLPVLIPPCGDADLADLLRRLDGVMFIGGDDYCPSTYGEKKHDSVQLAHDERTDFDFRLLQVALGDAQLPILGICAGCQLLNIGLGGSLHQDIPSEFPSSNVQHSAGKDPWKEGFNKHKIILESGTKLAKIFAGTKEINVPTSHHQAVKRVGEGLIPAALAEDGVIEAVELPSRPFVIGVQWHPERDYEGNASLFTSFVQACAAHMQDRVSSKAVC